MIQLIFGYHSGSASQARMRAEEYAIANYRDFPVGAKAVPAREQRRCDTTGGKLFPALGSWSLPAKTRIFAFRAAGVRFRDRQTM
jgi:hypothetical protein